MNKKNSFTTVRKVMNKCPEMSQFCFDLLTQWEKENPYMSTEQIWQKLCLSLSLEYWDLEQDFLTVVKDNQQMRKLLK